MVAYSATAFAEHSDAVCFVYHDACIVFFSEAYNLFDICDIAFHGEHAVGDNEFYFVRRAFLELFFERLHVVVFVFERLAERQAATFYYRSVVLFVPKDVVFSACEG